VVVSEESSGSDTARTGSHGGNSSSSGISSGNFSSSGSGDDTTSSRRLIFTGKYVSAVQTLSDGTTQEYDLGVPAFEKKNGTRNLVGFYSKNEGGKIIFRPFADLQSSLTSPRAQAQDKSGDGPGSPDGVTTISAKSNQNDLALVGEKSSSTSQPPQSTTPHHHGASRSSERCTGEAAEPDAQSHPAVRELLTRISPADMSSCLTVSSDRQTGELDLSGLYANWRVWADSEKLRVNIN